MSSAIKVATVSFLILMAAGYFGASRLFPVCDFYGGMSGNSGITSRNCDCLGFKLTIRDEASVDGITERVCIGKAYPRCFSGNGLVACESISNPEPFACTSDSDCAIADTSCCPDLAVNIKYLLKYKSAYDRAKCAAIKCASVRAACSFNVCILLSR